MEVVLFWERKRVRGRWAREIVIDESTPRVPGLSGNQFLHGVATVSAHEKAVVECGAFAKASDNEVIHASLEAPHPTDRTMSEAMIHVNGFALEVGEALFGFDGEFLHHREPTVVTKGVLHDALSLFVCF